MVAFPLVVTIFFARFIFGLMDKWFRPISERFVGEPLVGVGLVVSLVLLLLLGVVATNVLGGRLLDYFEKRISGLSSARSTRARDRSPRRSRSTRTPNSREWCCCPFQTRTCARWAL
jgi:hypothetical protein